MNIEFPSPKSEIGRLTFRHRAAIAWNSLPDSIKNSSTLECFKRRLRFSKDLINSISYQIKHACMHACIPAVVSKCEEYCIPRENTIHKRFLFCTRDQRESEKVDQYLTELRQIAANCDFESITPDQLLWDRLVTGTKSAKVHENLLKEKKLTLEKAIDIARAAESTAVQMKVMSAEPGLSTKKEKEKSENFKSVKQVSPHSSGKAERGVCQG